MTKYQTIQCSAHHMPKIPDASVQAVICSPPYFGLRQYADDQSVEWPTVEYSPMPGLPAIRVQGCEPGCKHEWANIHHKGQSGGTASAKVQIKGQDNFQIVPPSTSNYCIHCGGWRGGLGLESDPFAYIGHLILCLREWRRVLRDDGTAWINLGDSYFGGGGAHKPEHANPGLSRSASRGGAQRAAAYGTSGKEPANYLERDCPCGSLCDECRVAYRIGKSHNAHQHDPKLAALLYAPSRGHMEFAPGHPPTSDFVHQAFHTSDAIQGLGPASVHESGQPLSFQESTPDLSSPRPLDSQTPDDSFVSCRLCGRSFDPCVQESEYKSFVSGESQIASHGIQGQTLNTSSNVATDDSSGHRTGGKACDFCSYLDYTTTSHQPPTGLKPKDLMQVPQRFALAAQADGWYLRSAIVWAKGVSFLPDYAGSCMPESVTDRPTQGYEMVYMLAKSEKYYYDAQAVREPGAGKLPFGNKDKFKMNDGMAQGRHGDSSLFNGGSKEDYIEKYYMNGRQLRNVWVINPQPTPMAHFATWPPKLVEPMIKASTSEKGCCAACGAPWRRITERTPMEIARSSRRDQMGEWGRTQPSGTMIKPPTSITTGWQPSCTCAADVIPCTVLDPFAGSGTTLMVANKLGRRAIGVDLSTTYLTSLVPERMDEVSTEPKRLNGHAADYADSPLFAELAK